MGIPVLLWLAVSLTAFGQSIQDIVNQVSENSYKSYLGYPGDGGNLLYTHAGYDRQWSSYHDLARGNIFNSFTGLGLATSLDPFNYSGIPSYNVVAVQPGAVRPNDIFIVGAHYDSVTCPGADDNASGVAGIMEAARVLSQYDFEATVAFIAFDREEVGLYGSDAYATAAKARGDNILGMISLDMIAYNAGGNNMAHIYGRSASDPLKLALATAEQTYGGLSIQIGGQNNNSDHAKFEQQGYQASLLIEDYIGNPNYHTSNDNVDTPNYLDYTFATKITKGVVGYLAGSAVIVVPEPATWALLIAGGIAVGIVRLRRR